jgi:hypothetical protein
MRLFFYILGFLFVCIASGLVVGRPLFLSNPPKFRNINRNSKICAVKDRNVILPKRQLPAVAAVAREGEGEGSGRGDLKSALRRLVGVGMGVGSIALYLPMIQQLYSSKSTNGLDPSSLLTALVGNSCALLYSTKRGLPLDLYVEQLTIAMQLLVVCTLWVCYHFQHQPCPTALGGGGLGGGWLRVLRQPSVLVGGALYMSLFLTLALTLPSLTPTSTGTGTRTATGTATGTSTADKGKGKDKDIGNSSSSSGSGSISISISSSMSLKVLQLAGLVLSNAALVPQLVANYRSKSTRWPLSTAALACLGHLLRVGTGLLAPPAVRDSLVLVSASASGALNILLVVQILRYTKR